MIVSKFSVDLLTSGLLASACKLSGDLISLSWANKAALLAWLKFGSSIFIFLFDDAALLCFLLPVTASDERRLECFENGE